jgi:hypothetical protein
MVRREFSSPEHRRFLWMVLVLLLLLVRIFVLENKENDLNFILITSIATTVKNE